MQIRYNQVLKWLLKTSPIFLFVLLIASVVSQAQQTLLAELVIKLWPEYDQPETLVIYQGKVAPSVALPATLTFNLPPNVNEVNAVAVLNEEGTLVNNPYTLESGQLSFSVESVDFHFEYYDPSIIVKENTQRTLNYNALIQYPIARTEIEIQQPLQAQDMQFDPAPSETIIESDELTYHLFHLGATTPEDNIAISGTYAKQNDTLTAGFQVDIPPSANISTPSTISETDNFPTEYVLIGSGVLLLVVVGGVWFYNNNRTQSNMRRPPRKRGSVKKSKTTYSPTKQKQSQPTSGVAKYCHKCGTPYRDQARFCHKCGTEK